MNIRIFLPLCAILALTACNKKIVPEISLEERTATISCDGGSASTTLTCNCTWTTTTSLETITVDPLEGDGDATVHITVPANNTGSIRSLRITFKAQGTEKTATAKFVITQDAQPFVSFATEALTIDAAGGGRQIVLESNDEWSTTLSDTGITVSPASGSYTQTLLVTVPANTTGAPVVHTVTAALVRDASVKSTFTLTQSN